MTLICTDSLRVPRSLIIFAHDVMAAQASLVLAMVLTHEGRLDPAAIDFLIRAVPLAGLAAAACFVAFRLHRHVWSYTSIGELGAIAQAATATVALFAVIDGLVLPAGAPPAILVVQWFILLVLLCGSRLVYRSARAGARRATSAAGAESSVLIYGCDRIASLFIRAVQPMRDTSVRVVGIIDDDLARRGRQLHQVPVLGPLHDLDRILAELAVQGICPRQLLVAGPALLPRAQAEAERCRPRHSLELRYLPDLMSLPGAAAVAETVEGARAPLRPYFRIRRVAEAVVSAAALLLLAPLIAAIALAVLLDLGRPVLFRQLRPGRHMRPFTLYKFRTMGAAWRPDGALLLDHQRTSALGRFLRRSRLDELPQLVNVLKGDMAFIGPRPLLPRDLPAEAAERFAIRPGLTGWAQVNGGHQLTAAEKLALDRWYLRHASPAVDARILWRTLRMMIKGEEINRPEIDFATASGDERQRLLVVNRYFHPDECATSQLLTDLVASLDRRRFAVTVITGRRNYVNTGATLPAGQCLGGAEVRRIRHTDLGRGGLPARAVDCATFAASAFLTLLGSARPGDLILAKTDPPLLSVVAWLAARLTGARLVNWCQDLFPETAVAMRLRLVPRPVAAGLRRLRNLLSLRGAELNVALCEAMAARLEGEGVARERLTIIPNWADGDAIRPLAPADNPLRREWGLGDDLVLGYSGNLGFAHEVEGLIGLMAALKDEPGLVFLFVGAGGGYARLRAAAAEHGIANTVFRPYQPRARLPLSLTAPDLHLVTLRPAFEGLVMPSKLYGALAAGRPVVFIGDPAGSVAQIVARGLGLVAAHDAVAPLAAAIRALRRDPARLREMGAAARRAYETRYNQEASLAAWATCLAALAHPAAQLMAAE